ncbi:MAG: hypothetical protein OXH75_09160 [Acidobacteria bacterium]|nr:hypothetical protein [Acidobacteriota bacterium]
MKKTLIVSAGLALALAAAPPPARAQPTDVAPEDAIHDARSAMEFLKSLAGDWVNATRSTEHGTSSPVASFRVIAGGSAVVETTGAGTPNEMTTVFHMDGDQLLQTHYCALQNAPVLRFEPSDVPGELKFVFHGGTNFDPQVDAHFHDGSIRIQDKDTVETSYVVHANGEPSTDGRALLERAKPSTN